MPKISAATVAEHREHTYQALLDATDALIVERGFASVSMRDIAERAGVARTAIYNYASDKKTLLAASVQRTAATLHAALLEEGGKEGVSAADRLDAVVKTLLTFASSTQNLLILRSSDYGVDQEEGRAIIGPYQDEVGEHIGSLIRQGIDAGQFTTEIDVALTVDLMAGVVDAALDRIKENPAAAESITVGVVSFLQRALGRH